MGGGQFLKSDICAGNRMFSLRAFRLLRVLKITGAIRSFQVNPNPSTLDPTSETLNPKP